VIGEAVGLKVVEDNGEVAARNGEVRNWLDERKSEEASSSEEKEEE